MDSELEWKNCIIIKYYVDDIYFLSYYMHGLNGNDFILKESNPFIIRINKYNPDTWATSSGNSNRWEYTVSAKFLDSKNYVEWIKTEWYAFAKIRKSTVITLGIEGSTTKELTVSASASSEWQTKYTPKAHWTNGNYYTISDWANTLVINSRSDYAAGSRGITNTASVKVFGDPKAYSIAATT